jgi:endonuclease/exonuclease/phosphatase family metal-dependent hydrolase
MRWLRRGCLFALLLVLACSAAARCPVVDEVIAVPAATPSEIAVATQNLWRLSERELTTAGKTSRLAAWSRHLRDVLRYPHVLVVQEVDTLAMLQALTAQIVADGGPVYQAVLIDGNDPSGIDVALLYREPVKIDPVKPLFAREQQGKDWLFSRPPLHVQIREPFAFDLLALHLRSGHGLHDPEQGPRVRSKREAQAKRIRQWSLSRLAEGRALMLIGDINSAPGDDAFAVPIKILDQPPFWSVWEKLPQADRFSYIYRCQRQAIDHILLSPALRERVVRAAVSRGNAGRYRTLNATQGGVEVVSDHDAVLVYLRH